MNTQKTLEQLGYKTNEVKVYLGTLALGDCTVSDIAKKVKLPRTSVQVLLEKLHKNGLINVYTKKRQRHWVAEDPEKLLLKTREQELVLESVMPSLKAIIHERGTSPHVSVFTGAEEIKLIHQDIIATKQPVLSIIPWDQWLETLGSEYVSDFINNRARHFLRMKLLTPETKTSIHMREHDQESLRVTRFLAPSDTIRNSLFIYGTKVAIITLNTHLPTGIVIDDIDTTQTMTTIFEILWTRSK